MLFRRTALGACSLAALAAMALGGSVAASTARKTTSAGALASSINVTVKDAPKGIGWASTKASAESITALDVGKTAVSCMKANRGKGGKVGPDPFGTLGKPGGAVEADVSSPTITESIASDGVPSFDSEVVVLSTAAQADADLDALSTSGDMACLATAVQTLYSIDVAAQTDISWAFKKLTRYGTGIGGVHTQFVLTATGSPTPLVEDEYFYVEGRAEISLQFFNLTTPFNLSWASSVIQSVMARAKALAGA